MASPRRNISRALFAALAACALWLAAVAPVHAQPQAPSKPRPKVALVLSGGGAMGIAHVGAILELERLGIRPDMVVGASMGSIVGGLYASGMTGDQLTHAVETMDWDAIFDTSPSRDGLTFRQKEQQADFPVKASLGVAHGRLRAPDALISDANLLLQLRQLVGVRGAVADFDQLPIPFRAVATDIETGHRVVIDHGELAGAMRASMSVPGVFAPYQLEGKLLVDGGMADNVPVDVAREMGADIVIVVATQTPMAKGAEVRSLPQVLGQTVTMLILANERQQLATLKPSDILISVQTGGLSAADFKKGAALIAAGRASARTQEAALGRLAEQRGFTAPAPVTRPTPVVGYVRVENDSRIDNEILLRHIQPFVGRPLDTQAVVAALQQIYAIGVFTRVDFTVESRDGQTGVVVHAQQKPGDENQLRPGLTIAAAGKGHSEFDLSLDYRLLQLDSHGSEARFVGVIGDRKEISAEYFKVIDSRQRWFVLPKIDLFRRPIAVYDSSGFRLGEYDVGAAVASLAAGRQFGGFGEVRLGIQAGRGEANVQEGQLLQPHLNLDVGQLFARAAADTLDNPYFPTRGVKGSLEWTGGYTALGDVADFQTVTARGLYTASFSRRDTVILNFEAGDTVSGTLPVSSLYTLGGAFNFPGFATDELTGDAYMVARAIYRRRLSDNSQSLFGVPLFAGATLAAGNTWVGHGIETSHMRVGANVYLAADTVIGPVFLALGAAEGGRTGIYVFVGRPF